MVMNSDSKAGDKILVVDHATGKQIMYVHEVNIHESWMGCYEVDNVWDVTEEKEVEVIKKERDQTYKGPGVRYILKMFRRFADFDIVDKETGVVLAEARYVGVTSRLG